jgi:hypothetical protein
VPAEPSGSLAIPSRVMNSMTMMLTVILWVPETALSRYRHPQDEHERRD